MTFDRGIFSHLTVGTDFRNGAIFPKTDFFDSKGVMAETVRNLWPKRKNTTPKTLISVNIHKNPRQRRQFDPLSRADQNELFLKRSTATMARVVSQGFLIFIN